MDFRWRDQSQRKRERERERERERGRERKRYRKKERKREGEGEGFVHPPRNRACIDFPASTYSMIDRSELHTGRRSVCVRPL